MEDRGWHLVFLWAMASLLFQLEPAGSSSDRAPTAWG